MGGDKRGHRGSGRGVLRGRRGWRGAGLLKGESPSSFCARWLEGASAGGTPFGAGSRRTKRRNPGGEAAAGWDGRCHRPKGSLAAWNPTCRDEHWDHPQTSNPIGSVFSVVRHRTVRTQGALLPTTAQRRVFKLVQAAAKKGRRLKNAPPLSWVKEGVVFSDGAPKKDHANRAA